jgi:hypothetical protein
MVWYSAEVAGTIMVQCIPVMRPILGEVKTSLTSKRLAEAEDMRTTSADKKRESARAARTSTAGPFNMMSDDEFMLAEMGWDAKKKCRIQSQVSMSPSEVDRAIEASRTQPLEWPLSGNEAPVIGSSHPDKRSRTFG